MIKKTLFLLIFFTFLVILFSSCSRPLLDQQLMFGIDAAHRDLWDEAIFRWQKVIQSKPTSVAAHNNLAVAYERKGLWEEAKKEYEIALKLSPDNSYVKSNYKNFMENYEAVEKESNEKK